MPGITKYNIKALEDGCWLLRELSGMGPSTLREIALATENSTNKTYRVLHTFINARLMEEKDGRYFITYDLIDIALRYMENLEKVTAKNLAERTLLREKEKKLHGQLKTAASKINP